MIYTKLFETNPNDAPSSTSQTTIKVRVSHDADGDFLSAKPESLGKREACLEYRKQIHDGR
jgi:hypothetical protein